jgi:hypothetical protein
MALQQSTAKVLGVESCRLGFFGRAFRMKDLGFFFLGLFLAFVLGAVVKLAWDGGVIPSGTNWTITVLASTNLQQWYPVKTVPYLSPTGQVTISNRPAREFYRLKVP